MKYVKLEPLVLILGLAWLLYYPNLYSYLLQPDVLTLLHMQRFVEGGFGDLRLLDLSNMFFFRLHVELVLFIKHCVIFIK